MIKTVVFDLDNTLYDYDKVNTLAEKKLIEKLKASFAVEDEAAALLIKKAKQNVKKQLGEVGASHNRLLYMQNICEQLGVKPAIYAMELYDTYWDCMLEEMQLYPYVRELLERLKQKDIKIGLLTDLTAHIQYRKLKKLGIESYFDYIVTSEEAGAEKPSAKMFELMLQKTGNKPEEMLMIGDSLEKDIKGAEKCGMQTLLFEPNLDMIKCVGEKYEADNRSAVL